MAEQQRRKVVQTAYTSGLSVSHDSVFTGEHSAGSGSGESADESNGTQPSAPSQQRTAGTRGNQYMTSGVRAELLDVVRRRGRVGAGAADVSDDDEDLGLPQSPPGSPATDKGIKRHHAAKSQSSCSDNSLLSVGSSEIEEDISSPGAGLDGPSNTLDTVDGTGEEPPTGVAPLSHSAARHKMAVKPRRTHGAPRRRRNAQVSASSALPTTPEVNEEGPRHTIADNITVTDSYISEKITTTAIRTTNKQMQFERIENSIDECSYDAVPQETKLKSSSLPLGLALSQVMGQSPIKLSLSEQKDSPQSSIKRSKSSAQNKNVKNIEESNGKQSVSEKNLTHHTTEWNEPASKHMSNILRSMDLKFSSAAPNDIHSKFSTVGEDEELLNSGNFEPINKADVKKGEKKSEQHRSESHSEKKDSSKKEDSFFSRLLLRKSGKKAKKETQENELIQAEQKKSQSKNFSPQHYKQLKSDLNPPQINYIDHSSYTRHQKMSCSEQSSHKSVGQKIFSNQVHKRIDKKGGYVNDSLIQEANYIKGSVTDYGVNDLKHFAEIEKVASEIQQAPTDHRKLSNENIHRYGPVPYQRLRQRVEPIDIPSSPESLMKPQLPPKHVEMKNIFPVLTQQIKPQTISRENVSGILPVNVRSSTEDFSPMPALPVKHRSNQDLVFPMNNFASPKQIPTSVSADKSISYSVSPPRSVWPQNYDSKLNHKSNSQNSLNPNVPLKFNLQFDINSDGVNERPLDVPISKPKIAGLSSYQQKISQMENELENNADFSSFTDLAEFRNPVSKSQSFRFMSDAVTMNSHQENQMPSLPTMFGYSDSSMESWETNYKRQLREESEKLVERNLENRRKSASNIFANADGELKMKNINSISKDNDSDYKDTKKLQRSSLYNKNIVIGSQLESKCDADISQIEANIDSIIGCPKPLITSALKSSSLDSIKGHTDKISDRNRKALSSESILNNTSQLNNSQDVPILSSVTFTQRDIHQASIQRYSDNPIGENFTIVNLKSSEDIHFEIADKNNEKIYENVTDFNVTKPRYVRNTSKTSENIAHKVPEFMKIQLNKVDPKASSNVVLSTSQNITPNDDKASTPKKSPEVINVTPKSVKKYRESLGDIKSATIDRSFTHEKNYYEDYKPHRKFSVEDVEIIEKSTDTTPSPLITKTGSQQQINKSTDNLSDNSVYTDANSFRTSADAKYSNNILNQNNRNSNLPPLSPTAYKPFYKKRQNSMEIIDTKIDSNRRMSNGVAIYENVTYENNTKSSKEPTENLQKSLEDLNGDNNVVLRKKATVGKNRKDDEPELMKVFARRSLKLKDSEAEALAQEILESNENALLKDNVVRNKTIKGDFNAMIKSRDSDKENESSSPNDNRKVLLDLENKHRNSVDSKKTDFIEPLQAQRVMKKPVDIEPQSPKRTTLNPNVFSRSTNGIGATQRSVSIGSVSSALFQSKNSKNDSKNDTILYKKEVSDLTPEKRLRNRTFPDSSNESAREDISATSEALNFKCDTSSLPKRAWNQNKSDDNLASKKIPYRNSSFATIDSKKNASKPQELRQSNFIDSCSQGKDGNQTSENSSTDNETYEGEADGSPQFRGILQMRAEWERRAKQAMTK